MPSSTNVSSRSTAAIMVLLSIRKTKLMRTQPGLSGVIHTSNSARNSFRELNTTLIFFSSFRFGQKVFRVLRPAEPNDLKQIPHGPSGGQHGPFSFLEQLGDNTA